MKYSMSMSVSVGMFISSPSMAYSLGAICLALRIRNPAARGRQLQVDENNCLPISPTEPSNDLPRALTECGQQSEVGTSRWPAVGVAINQSAIDLLRLLAGVG